MTIKDVKSLVTLQAEDDGLWFHARYASEAYLQAALRQLHAAVEALDGGKRDCEAPIENQDAARWGK